MICPRKRSSSATSPQIPLGHDDLGVLLRHERIGEVVLGDEQLPGGGRTRPPTHAPPRLHPQAHQPSRAPETATTTAACPPASTGAMNARSPPPVAGAVRDALEHHRVV